MSTFHGGPADQVSLTLRRSPKLLRVVYDTNRDEFDALDQLADEVRPGETPYAYRRTSVPFTGMIDYRDKSGRRTGHAFSHADYLFVDPQPPRSAMDSTAAWRDWCREQAALDAGTTEARHA